jgi:anti-anti-sigma factor
MSELAHVDIEHGEGLCLVRVRGEVDISNAHQLMAVIEDALPNETPTLALDLTATTYLDSAGIHVLFLLAQRLQDRRHTFRLIVPEGAPIRAVLELTGLPSVVRLETALP